MENPRIARQPRGSPGRRVCWARRGRQTFSPLRRAFVLHTPRRGVSRRPPAGLECRPSHARNVPDPHPHTAAGPAAPDARAESRAGAPGDLVGAGDARRSWRSWPPRTRRRSSRPSATRSRDRLPLPAPAVREVVENLVHAGLPRRRGQRPRRGPHGPRERPRARASPTRAGAPARLHHGRRRRPDDDPRRRQRPAASPRRRWPSSAGRLELADNLGGGTAVTLRLPPAERGRPRPRPGLLRGRPRDPRPAPRDRRGARPRAWPGSSTRSRAECGRELAHLEHRGLVRREPAARARSPRPAPASSPPSSRHQPSRLPYHLPRTPPTPDGAPVMSLSVPAPRPRRRLEGGPRAPRATLNTQVYEFAFAGARPVELTDERIVLAVESELLRQWIRQRYLALLRDALFEVRGADLEVDIEVAPARRARTRQDARHPGRPAAPRARDGAAPPAGERAAAALHLRGLRDRALQPLRPRRGARRGRGAGARVQPVLHLRRRRPGQDPPAARDRPLRAGEPPRARAHATSRWRPSPTSSSTRCATGASGRSRTATAARTSCSSTTSSRSQGREQTQEEFFHTFNALHDSGKQIVISSDRPPKAIATLEDRLRSRFEMGLITDVQPPDIETRIAILQKRVQADRYVIHDPEVLSFIAGRVSTNVRALEGALTRVVAHGSISGRRIDVELAGEVLEDLFPAARGHAQHRGDPGRGVPLLRGHARGDHRRQAHAPDRAARARSRCTSAGSSPTRPCPQIGRSFGGRDHTTVMYAVQKVADQMSGEGDVLTAVRDAHRPSDRPPRAPRDGGRAGGRGVPRLHIVPRRPGPGAGRPGDGGGVTARREGVPPTAPSRGGYPAVCRAIPTISTASTGPTTSTALNPNSILFRSGTAGLCGRRPPPSSRNGLGSRGAPGLAQGGARRQAGRGRPRRLGQEHHPDPLPRAAARRGRPLRARRHRHGAVAEGAARGDGRGARRRRAAAPGRRHRAQHGRRPGDPRAPHQRGDRPDHGRRLLVLAELPRRPTTSRSCRPTRARG